MSQVQIQIKPRRVRCEHSAPPPPFKFELSDAISNEACASSWSSALRIPVGAVRFLFGAIGRVIDTAFFLALVTLWCALHIMLWSYAFDMGPAAGCAGFPCPSWVAHKVVLLCALLASGTFIAAVLLRKLGHKSTSKVMLLLVTFDVAALIVLGINLIIN